MRNWWSGYTVVICFHFTIFVVLETTSLLMWVAYLLLWFAFILLSLSYWKQLVRFENVESGGCDLLSFYYLCRTGNNSLWSNQMSNSLWFAFILLSLSYWKQRFIIFPVLELVVICFHFTIFVVLETTQDWNRTILRALWFAFILLSLSYWKQRLLWLLRAIAGCDLLSFYYLCRTGNNQC